MQKVRLGRTNLTVAKLGWGGIPIQRVNEQEAVSVVRAVVEMGVELLDTARAYTNSEQRIGQALQKVSKPVVLSTKTVSRTAEKVMEDVQESLRLLQVQKIPIYHLHNLGNFKEYEKAFAPGGAYEGLQRARDKGWIEHIGMTSHSLDVLERELEEGHVSVIMTCYSFLEADSAERIFPRARAKDVGILAMKPFSGGVIEEAGPALRFVLSTPDVVSIPGVETLERARENWEIFAQDASLNEEDKAQIKRVRQEFDRQFCRRCDYCQPCSQDISIQQVLGLRSVFKRVGAKVHELGWMKSVVLQARNCTECGECMTRCPYQLPIPALIKENLEWFDTLKK